MKLPKKILLITLITSILGITFLLRINQYIKQSATDYIYSNTAENLEQIKKQSEYQAGLILGAKVYKNGNLSDILKDRIDTALEAYQAGLFSKFLISGDHGRTEYDEVNALKNYLLEKGIAAENIFLDHAGFDTYDSIYRAKEIFEIESMIIFTQEFHLPRAVYIARNLEIEALGIIADKQNYIAAKYNETRETLARLKAFLEITFGSKPEFLGEKIPITGDSSLSWD